MYVVALLLCRILCDPIDCSPAHPAALSVGFSRQEYWSGLPFPSPGELPDPGAETVSSALAGGFFTTEPPGKLEYAIVTNILMPLNGV